MTFIDPGPSAADAPNYRKVFSHRPAVYPAYEQLGDAIKAGMDMRRYELVTLAAADALRSSYCALAHGQILAERFMAPEAVLAAVGDRQHPELDDLDIAVMDLAAKVAADATAVERSDVDRLRSLGLADAEILDVVLAASLRCFFSKVLDGAGARADASFAEMEPALREALTVGRPIADADVQT